MSQSVWKRLLEPHIPLKRRYRRALVLAFHGGYAALLVLLVPQLSALGLQTAYFVLIACWLFIFMTTGFIGDKREKELDERQRDVRNRAHRVYWTSGELDNGTLAMYALLSYVVLPSSVIAWLEPDEFLKESIMRKTIQAQDVIANPRVRAFLGKRRNRRVLVITGSLVYLALPSPLLFTSRLSFATFIALTLLLAAVGCLHGVLLNVGTQLIAANRVNNLDEREQGVWARAHHSAYRLIVFGTSAVMLYLGAAAVTVLPLPGSSGGWWALVPVCWGALVMLPSGVLYWTEPDLEPNPLVDV